MMIRCDHQHLPNNQEIVKLKSSVSWKKNTSLSSNVYVVNKFLAVKNAPVVLIAHRSLTPLHPETDSFVVSQCG